MNNNPYFFEYMKSLLGDSRFAEFFDAYTTKPRHKALRVNTRKISSDEFKKLSGYDLKPNPLCDCSFYCDIKPSLDPLYHAGLYYMQEPSASAAVAAFMPFIGKRVLDLCAAPGGKSTQAAAGMNGGIIFCNDPEYKRTRVLAENIERLGFSNAVITCNTASDYRNAGFDGYFDTLIVDAPCSGGGMMRYEDVPYSREIVEGCAERQRGILRDAVELLGGGGYMLYSTCTFAVEENEQNVKFLRELGMQTVDIPLPFGTERGIGEPDARRVYPMNFDGEGHFYCVLKKSRGASVELPHMRVKRGRVRIGGAEIATVEINKRVLLPINPPETNGLNVVRLGTAVYGEGKDVSHSLIHALSPDELKAFGSIELGDMASAYIRGEQIDMRAAAKGMLAATVNGYAIGLVKSAPSGAGGNVLKNKYPKPLRI